MPCEDAPCCGCCGTNLYGENQEDYSVMSYEWGDEREWIEDTGIAVCDNCGEEDHTPEEMAACLASMRYVADD